MGNKSASRCGRMSNANEVTCCHLADYFFFFWFGRRVPAKIASCRGGWRVSCFRLRTKLAESWPAPPPPPFSAIFLFQSHNKREKGGHLATLVELVEHIFVGRTELATVDGSTSGGEVHGIFSSLQIDFRDLKGQTERFPDFWNVRIWRQLRNLKKIKLNRIKSSN